MQWFKNLLKLWLPLKKRMEINIVNVFLPKLYPRNILSYSIGKEQAYRSVSDSNDQALRKRDLRITLLKVDI